MVPVPYTLPKEGAAMSNIQVAVTEPIDAPPARVYAILADYRNHHPHILPKAYFVKVGGKRTENWTIRVSL